MPRYAVTPHRALAGAAFAGYAGTVVLANWLVARFGVVPVGFGLYAPAAVYAIGLALVLRDVVHELSGIRAAQAAIAVGVALSVAVSSGRLAVASGLAFAVSETLDLAVYTPLRRSGWTRAALLSSFVGAVADSVIFLRVAFGSLAFLPGQVLGKTVAVLVAVAVLAPLRRAWAARSA